MLSITAVIIVALFVCRTAKGGDNYPYTDSSNSIGWTQYWDLTDEFWNQNTLNSNKWYDYMPGWLGRAPGLFDPDNVAVSNNALYMNSGLDWNMDQEYTDQGYYTFTTSAVTAKTPLLYGYVEIRAKVGGSRVSSAFWLSNNEKWGGGSWTEIDIFEQAGTVGTTENDYHILHSNTHIFALEDVAQWKIASLCGCTGTDDCKDPDWWSTDSIESFSDDYHVYGLWWTSSFIKMYVDGELIRTTENKCFHQELYLKFDRETFPNWFGLPDTSDIPDDPFIIDYVRTWKQTDGYITITNKNGISSSWYAVQISGVPEGVTVTSVQMKDADMSSWVSGTDKTWYWSWYGDTYNGPFDFKVTLSTGQTITSYDLIGNIEVGTSGTISDTAVWAAAYTEDDENGSSSNTETVITVIAVSVILVIIACIAVGLFCMFKRRKGINKKIKEEVSTLEDDKDGDGDGYDMSPITNDVNDTESNGTLINDDAEEQDPEIEVETPVTMY